MATNEEFSTPSLEITVTKRRIFNVQIKMSARNFDKVWSQFKSQTLSEIMRRFPGDQDYLNVQIPESSRRFFDQDRIKSWRWQCLDGGYDFNTRRHHTPGTGTAYHPKTSVLVFHGQPKPDQVTDPVIQQHWK